MAIADSFPDCRESGGADSWPSGWPPRLQDINDCYTHVLEEAHFGAAEQTTEPVWPGRRHVGRKDAPHRLEIMTTAGLNPRFDIRRISLTIVVLENRGRLMIVFPFQSPRNANTTSISVPCFSACRYALQWGNDLFVVSMLADQRCELLPC
jgi:hypothetical protein